jgi:hypothetical protein
MIEARIRSVLGSAGVRGVVGVRGKVGVPKLNGLRGLRMKTTLSGVEAPKEVEEEQDEVEE